jgi:outer membrane immunogenic protein
MCAARKKEKKMRDMIKIFAAGVFVLGASTFAHAADAIDEVPAAPESQDVGYSSGGWEGGYVGGKLSHQWGKVRSGGGHDASGFGVGVYGGYNLQSDKIVYGAEADLNYSGIDSEHNNVTTSQGLNGSLRGRVGYDLEPALVYGTAGVAATSLKAEDSSSSKKKTLLGGTVGLGVETKITDTITARGEYRYSKYQSQTFGLDSGNVDRGLSEHNVSLGLGVRF